MDVKVDLSESRAGGVDGAAARRVGSLLLWAVTGFLTAFGIASLPSIGWLVLSGAGISLILAIVLTKGRGIAGAVVAAGLVGVLLAWLHRDGSSLNPVVFLGAGALAVLVGIGMEALVLSRRVDSR